MPKFTTVRFGELDYRREDVVFLPEGLVGMPSLRNWLILDMGPDVAMKWFQSLDRGDFGFPVSRPDFFLQDYQVDLSRGAREHIRNAEPGDLAVLIITTVHPGGAQVTGNMLAPLVIDTESRRGLQMTLDGNYSLRQEIDYFKFGLAVGGQAAENGEEDARLGAIQASEAEAGRTAAGAASTMPEPVAV